MRIGRQSGRTALPLLRRLLAALPEPDADGFAPVLLHEVELSHPLPDLAAGAHRSVQLLVRLHGHPLGTTCIDLQTPRMTAHELGAAVVERLGPSIRRHLQEDGAAAEISPDQLVAGLGAIPCASPLRAGAYAPPASVVVATRDRPDRIVACVDSLLELDYPRFEIIVADNAPGDERTAAAVRARYGSDPRVRYLVEPRPGVSLARNAGTRAARGEIVAFVDDDETVDPLWLAALVAGFASDTRVTCVTGLTLPMELETPAQLWFECYGGFDRGYEFRVNDLVEHREPTRFYPYTAGIFGGSGNVAFRREAFVEIGLFDPGLGGGSRAFAAEDLDAFLSVLFRGDRIAYQPAAIVRHGHRRAYRDLHWQIFTYSAALTALVLKRMIQDRHVALDISRRLPGVIPLALRASRGSADGACGSYPLQLRVAESLGYLYGPVAYAQTRRATRRLASAQQQAQDGDAGQLREGGGQLQGRAEEPQQGDS